MELNKDSRVVIISRLVQSNYPFFLKLTQIPYENVVLSMKEAS